MSRRKKVIETEDNDVIFEDIEEIEEEDDIDLDDIEDTEYDDGYEEVDSIDESTLWEEMEDDGEDPLNEDGLWDGFHIDEEEES
jgi:hypothetical protein